jgi:hypothetical protein
LLVKTRFPMAPPYLVVSDSTVCSSGSTIGKSEDLVILPYAIVALHSQDTHAL